MQTPYLQRTLISAALGLGALTWIGASHAATIDWVDFSPWVEGALSATGLTNNQPAPDDLVLDATFTGGDFNNSPLATMPRSAEVTLNDPAWPFSNDEIPAVVIRNSTQTLSTTLTLDFTNVGGLPAGGSIAVIDLEDPTSTVQLIGYQGGIAVAVNWMPSFYQTAGLTSPDPTWNPATNTLSGNIPIATAPIQLNNFAFLVSDIQLDSLDLIISQAATDGVAYAVSRQTVPQVPVPATLLLLGSGLIGMAVRRRKSV